MTRPPDPLNLFDLIQRRRTAHRFDPARPVEPELVERLISLATLAPQPGPLQPARFLVVQGEGNRRKLRRCAFGDARLTEAPVVVVVLGYLDPPRTDLAPLLAHRLQTGQITSEEAKRLAATVPRAWQWADPPSAATRAGMLATGTLILAAEGLGLASAWVDPIDRDRVRIDFGIPDDHTVVTLVALGHPVDSTPRFPGRLPLDRVMYAEHFGQPWIFQVSGESNESLALDPGAD